MLSRKDPNAPLTVTVPRASEDKPSWIKVGVIAAVGFIIGVSWPRLVGVRLGPNAPGETSTGASRTQAGAGSATAPTPAVGAPVRGAEAPPPVASVAPPAPASSSTGASSVVPPVVGHGTVLSCRTDAGEALKGVSACGSLAAFDAVAQPRLRRLATCASAEHAKGKLSTVFNLDFKSNRIGIDVGRSSTVPNADGFSPCLKAAFQGVSLGAMAHEQTRYAVAYSVKFLSDDTSTPEHVPALPPPAAPLNVAAPPSAPVAMAAPASGSAPAQAMDNADGAAEVVWEVALLRDTPRTGQVVARLARGTRLRIGAGEDGWYRAKFGPGYTSEGWIYRAAIGR